MCLIYFYFSITFKVHYLHDYVILLQFAWFSSKIVFTILKVKIILWGGGFKPFTGINVPIKHFKELPLIPLSEKFYFW